MAELAAKDDAAAAPPAPAKDDDAPEAPPAPEAVEAKDDAPDAPPAPDVVELYPIGTPGEKWGDAERAAWFARANVVQRSYADEVLAKLEPLRETFDVEQYGALSQDPERYPLYVIKTKRWDQNKPSALVTGGVHGYETSGVQGALEFAATKMASYAQHFNVAVCPCVSPWGYECVQRWDRNTVDPNRFFVEDSPCEACAAVVALVAGLGVSRWAVHLDLHETTDSDASEFMPARAARDGEAYEPEVIPDGYYIMGNKANPQLSWLSAIIDKVEFVTHVAAPDQSNCIMGLPCLAPGIVVSDSAGKGKGVTNAIFAATTEVYPDSKCRDVSSEECNAAQVTAVTAALDYIVKDPRTLLIALRTLPRPAPHPITV
mmetsp:Transcript_17700/g.52644  ORF Transcript_17700/g.52644 Transcript_17700/m.52644 type:complete len:374 (+) Transcript_17700:141-1262(+)